MEPQFHELYVVLGDKEAQNEIRNRATAKGCPLLRHNPSACLGCENNPYENPKLVERSKLLRKHGPLLNEAFRLLELSELGFIRSLDELTPEAFIALSILRVDMETQRIKNQAEWIAEKLAVVFGRNKS